jgi:periplasmic protein TonB
MLGNASCKTQFARSGRIAITASVLVHALAGALVICVSTLPRSVSLPEYTPVMPRYELVWIASPGPGGGGGGGGTQTKVAAPARQVGRDRVTVPAPTETPAPVETPQKAPIQPLTIPAKPMAAATDMAPGVVDSMPVTASTQGPGTGGGAETGTGTGSGEGRGSGLGPGFGGGTGGGAYRPGTGVSAPQLIREVKPNYTANAMRAKIQGAVLLECVVLPDGTVGGLRILKSLDKVFGLDEEAVNAAKQWRFWPGRRFGEPVPVLVEIELAFSLR